MNRKRNELLVAVTATLAAFALWYLIFVFPQGSFWVKMAVSACTLGVVSLLTAGRAGTAEILEVRLSHFVLGVITAALLYGIFWVGRIILVSVSDHAATAIRSVYAPRQGASLWMIGALLLLFTGPAEEIFWRGLVQRVAAGRVGSVGGWIAATGLYTAVHIWTRNLPLMLAALVAGLVWGWLYRRTGSLIPGIVSHSLWGVAIFVLWPLV